MYGVDTRRMYDVDPRRVHSVDPRFRGRAFPGACLLVCLRVGARSWGVVSRWVSRVWSSSSAVVAGVDSFGIADANSRNKVSK